MASLPFYPLPVSGFPFLLAPTKESINALGLAVFSMDGHLKMLGMHLRPVIHGEFDPDTINPNNYPQITLVAYVTPERVLWQGLNTNLVLPFSQCWIPVADPIISHVQEVRKLFLQSINAGAWA